MSGNHLFIIEIHKIYNAYIFVFARQTKLPSSRTFHIYVSVLILSRVFLTFSNFNSDESWAYISAPNYINNKRHERNKDLTSLSLRSVNSEIYDSLVAANIRAANLQNLYLHESAMGAIYIPREVLPWKTIGHEYVIVNDVLSRSPTNISVPLSSPSPC